jgi:hypothetical protein
MILTNIENHDQMENEENEEENGREKETEREIKEKFEREIEKKIEKEKTEWDDDEGDTEREELTQEKGSSNPNPSSSSGVDLTGNELHLTIALGLRLDKGQG